MRAGDKERPVILSLLPTLRAMPCAHQRQLPCAFPSVHLGTRLLPVTLPYPPPPVRRSAVAIVFRGPGRLIDQCQRLLRGVANSQRYTAATVRLDRVVPRMLSVDGTAKSHNTHPGWLGQIYESGHTDSHSDGQVFYVRMEALEAHTPLSPLPASSSSSFVLRFKQTPLSLRILYQLAQAACRLSGPVVLPPLERPVDQTSNMSVQQR